MTQYYQTFTLSYGILFENFNLQSLVLLTINVPVLEMWRDIMKSTLENQ